jgi:nucleoside-diphosphate-sugar epimerase
VTHILVSVPPDVLGDPVLRCCSEALIARAPELAWVGYLSTTGVYGDHGGGWVDEDTPRAPLSARARARAAAEDGWLALHCDHGLPVQVFRLAGIYGPGRNQIEAVLNGTARRIVKRNQVFSRIHVADIVGVLEASMAKPDPGRIYNVADDEPAAPEDVVAFAAELVGRPAPPETAFENATLSPMARSFYGESKRVSNRRIKQELGYRLRFPTYREGLRALRPT